MTCQRCDSMWGDEATFRITTEILDMEVCEKCAQEALKLGLLAEPLCGKVTVTQCWAESGHPAHL